MTDLDLNLLKVLVALAEERSVSRAALKLGKSQPAISAALSKLRLYFKDPLFLRAGNWMQPTPRAAAIAGSARSVLGKVDAEIIAPPVFDAAASDRPINLALSDVGEIVFLPAIMRQVRLLMPNAPVRSVSLPPVELAQQLESGGIDLAIGYFPDLLKGSFFQQTLFEDGFACLMRSEHAIGAPKLTTRQFLQVEHAVVRAESRTEEVIEQYLSKRGMQRRVVLTSPHFASTLIVVAQSDLVVTVPQPLAQYFADVSADLRVVALPFESPRIELRQFWHRRFHSDPRSRWLRGMVFEQFRARRERN
jgi:DNA-binding transcriptional LysR family regulator